MATLDLSRYKFNNYRNKVESTVKTVNTQVDQVEGFRLLNPDGTLKNTLRRQIVVGDILAIGTIPKNCYVTDMRVIFYEAFDDDTSFSVGFLHNYPDDDVTIEWFTEFKANIVNQSMYLTLPASGVLNPEGNVIDSADGDFRGGIWNDRFSPVHLGLLVKNGTIPTANALTTGKMKILVSYIRFGEEDLIREEVILS